jgi:hypothetical protein
MRGTRRDPVVHRGRGFESHTVSRRELTTGTRSARSAVPRAPGARYH